jgi:hypothetical protein
MQQWHWLYFVIYSFIKFEAFILMWFFSHNILKRNKLWLSSNDYEVSQTGQTTGLKNKLKATFEIEQCEFLRYCGDVKLKTNWAITGSWEPLLFKRMFENIKKKNAIILYKNIDYIFSSHFLHLF